METLVRVPQTVASSVTSALVAVCHLMSWPSAVPAASQAGHPSVLSSATHIYRIHFLRMLRRLNAKRQTQKAASTGRSTASGRALAPTMAPRIASTP